MKDNGHVARLARIRLVVVLDENHRRCLAIGNHHHREIPVRVLGRQVRSMNNQVARRDVRVETPLTFICPRKIDFECDVLKINAERFERRARVHCQSLKGTSEAIQRAVIRCLSPVGKGLDKRGENNQNRRERTLLTRIHELSSGQSLLINQKLH